jgi:putative endonuclease
VIERVMYGLMRLAARRGFGGAAAAGEASDADGVAQAKARARRTGIRGEMFAYWYLRRQGYVFIARNFMVSGVKGEIDLVGYDGDVLAFVEVKTRSEAAADAVLPEYMVNQEKQMHLRRMARRFLAERRLRNIVFRFDILAIESRANRPPAVRLHKGGFSAG